MSRGRRLIAATLLAAGGWLAGAPAHAAIDGVLHETSCIDDATAFPAGPCADVSQMIGIGQIAVYGNQLYVPSRTSNSLLVFDRNADGSLSQKSSGAGCFNTTGSSGCTNAGPGLTNAIAAAVSPDGNQVYVVAQGENAIVVFARAGDGTLTPEHCYTATVVTGCSATSGATFPTLNGPVAVAVSPDSKSVYVASLNSPGVLSAFNTAPGSALTPTTGNGTYSECIWGGSAIPPPNCISGSALFGPARDVIVSPDGNQVYVANTGNGFTGNVLAFDRDTNSSNSTFGSVKPHTPTSAGCLGQGAGCGSFAGLESPNQLAISPDGTRMFAGERTTWNVMAIDRSANGDIAAHAPTSCVGACSGGIGYAEPFDVVITPDAQHVYAGALSNSGITLNSNAAGATPFTQAPLPLGCDVTGTQGGSCLDLPNGGPIESLAVSPDSRFLYATVDNGPGGAGVRVLTLQIDRAPVCSPVATSTPYATAVTIQLACSDPDGDPLTFAKLSDPARGILGALQPGGQITYSPFGGTSGADSFTYDAVGNGVASDPQTVTINVGAPPPPPPPPPVQTRRIHLSTVGSWTVTDRGVLIAKMVLHGLQKGDKVKLTCSSCHVKQTLTSNGTTLSLTKLKHKVLKRGKSFTVIATASGAIGDDLTLTVKKYGHKHADFVRESNAPFRATHRCLPVGSSKPQKTC